MGIKIRKATIKDIKKVADFCYEEEKLHKRFDKNAILRKDARKKIYNFLKSKIKSKDYAAFVAEDGNKVIGILTGNIQKSYFTYKIGKVGHYGTAFVKKEYRKKGIIKELVKSINKWFKSKNIKFSDCYVHSQNKTAFKVWKILGFKEVMKVMRKKIK